MFSYIWPLGLVIISNIVYQICAKSVPGEMNPFASLVITYLMAALTSAVLFFALGGGASFAKEISKTNWTPFVLGIVINGLDLCLQGWLAGEHRFYRSERFYGGGTVVRRISVVS